jgi:TetR/AcrR family transcriptional regulator, lmrAB and yxaGH operons repressor
MPTPNAKSRFIATAATLFRRSGYHAVGLTEIIAAANAPKGSFYHHFPDGKEELAEHAMRWAADAVLRAIHRGFDGAPDFASGANSLASELARWFEASSYTDGCPITSIALDTTPQSKRLTGVAAEIFDGWIAAGAGHAERFGHSHEEAKSLALSLLCALEGAWVMARILRSTAPFTAASALISAALRTASAQPR